MLKHRAVRFVALQLALCLLLLAVWWRLGLDDSFIFLVYARNLVQTGLWAFNAGVPSYGFSSPAWVLVLAGVSRVTTIPVSIFLSNAIGVVMCALASLAAWTMWDALEEHGAGERSLVATVLFSGPWFFTVWFIFGMETGLAILGIFGFALAMVKRHAETRRGLWLLLCVVSAVVLALTRLESAIYIAVTLVGAVVADRADAARRRRAVVALLLAGGAAAAAEVLWMLYAHARFGTYTPWTSTARLIYYLPSSFVGMTGAAYAQLGVGGRMLLALRAAIHIALGGPMKVLLVAVPLVATGLLLYSSAVGARLKSVLRIAALGLAVQVVVFAVLFPLAQNRHLTPYIAALWVLVVPGLIAVLNRSGGPVRVAVAVAAVALWAGGALLYRQEGLSLEPLHQIAATLKPGDRVGAEPIGIIGFEGPITVADIGGITDHASWPLLMNTPVMSSADMITWDLQQGANKMILNRADCDEKAFFAGRYCLADAAEAQRVLRRAGR